MNSYTIRYHVDMYKVRSLCIRENYYTCGDNPAYEHMLLDMCDGDTFETLIEIAEDIAEHSDMEKLCAKYDGKPVDTILEYLVNECTWTEPVRIPDDNLQVISKRQAFAVYGEAYEILADDGETVALRTIRSGKLTVYPRKKVIGILASAGYRLADQ